MESYRRLEESSLEAIESLNATVDAKDPYTAGHSIRVGRLSAFLRAKRDVLRQWRALWRKRGEVQRSRSVAVSHIDSALSRDWMGPKLRKFRGSAS